MTSDQSSIRPWLIVLGLAMAPAVGNGFARFAYGLLLPAMREDLGWNYTEAGWIGTANAIGYFIGAILALKIIRQVSPARIFLQGMVWTAVALLLSGITSDFWMLTVLRIVTGITGAVIFIAGGALASTLFRDNPSRSALAIAVYFGGGGLGVLLSGILIPILFDHLGPLAWSEAWLVLGALSALAVVPSYAAISALRIPAPAPQPAVPARLPVRRLLALLIGYFTFGAGYIVYMTFLVAWMRTNGASTGLVSATWAIIGISIMASPFLWRPVLAASRGGMALALACTATGTGTLLPLLFPGPIGVLISAALFGSSIFITASAVTSFSRTYLAEELWGPSVALFTIVFAVGQTIGPTVAGLISDQTNTVTVGLAGAGVIQLLGAIVATRQKPLLP